MNSFTNGKIKRYMIHKQQQINDKVKLTEAEEATTSDEHTKMLYRIK